MTHTQHIPTHSKEEIHQKVKDLLSKMTLAEKIGQMTQVEKNSLTPQDITDYAIGSVLSGGGGNPEINNVNEWRKMVIQYMEASTKTRLGIPLVYGVDAVHGHNNVIGATIFPHNVGLGASRDADLVERIGYATASEVLATNVHWNFAPAVSVPQDIRWGRTYEGYSENTDVVRELGAAYVRGLQRTQENHDNWVLASVKHFVGDGGTEWDSRQSSMPNALVQNNWQSANENWKIDQGDTRIDEETLRRIHLEPYRDAINAGAENIMVSFSSWNGLKMHAHEYLLTQVLKKEWGFEGFLVSDWMALSHLSADDYEAVVMSINAGLDMIMVPFEFKVFINDLTKAVENGDVAMSRIDDAVERILRVKFMMGLFDNIITGEHYLNTFGSDEHRQLAREAVQKSATLLKNENKALPILNSAKIGVAGIAADDIGLACGGWTIEWQGGSGTITPGSTLLEGLKEQASHVVYSLDGKFDTHIDTVVVVIAEKPTAEGEGDNDNLTISDEQTTLIETARQHCDKLVLVIYSGRPQVITHVVEHCDAIIAAWLPGSEASALADSLMGTVPFTGKLPFTWIKSMEQVPLSTFNWTEEKPLWAFDFGINTTI